MSILYCKKCHSNVDTDFNAEHFAADVNGCETTFEGEDLLGEKENIGAMMDEGEDCFVSPGNDFIKPDWDNTNGL